MNSSASLDPAVSRVGLPASALASAMVVGVIGALIIWMVPGFMGLLPGLAALNDQQLGYVASWDVNVIAVSIAVSAFLLHRFNWRLLVAIGLVLMVAGNIATGMAHSYTDLVLARVIAGAGEGLAIGLSFAALGRAKNPDRAFAIYLVAGAIFSAVLLWILPTLQSRFGSPALFLGLAGMIGSVGLILVWFPDGRLPPETRRTGAKIDRRAAIAGLAGVFFYFMVQGAMWGYFERIGQAHRLSPDKISQALAIATFAGIGGAAAASVLPKSLGRGLPLLASGVVSVLSFQLLLGNVTGTVLLVSGVLLTFAWNLSQPLLSGLCSEADPEGRIVAAMGSIQTLGYGFGPAAAALALRNENFAPIIWSSSVVLAISLLIVIIGIREPLWPRQASSPLIQP